MPLLKDGGVVADPWRRIDDAGPLPPDGPVIVSLRRWQAAREALVARGAPLGVALKNTEPVAALAPDVGRLELIALEFPKFTDGRAFTQARIVRERLGFRGELRATGQVLPDQLAFMRRCGFDAFELAKDEPNGAWLNTVATFSEFYQQTGDGRAPIAVLRRRRRAAAGGDA